MKLRKYTGRVPILKNGERHATKEELLEWSKEREPSNIYIRAFGSPINDNNHSPFYPTLSIQEYLDGRKPEWKYADTKIGLGGAYPTFYLVEDSCK